MISIDPPPGQTTTFQIRGSNCTMMSLRLIHPGEPAFAAELRAKTAQAPNFFRNAPIILDFTEIKDQEVDLRTLLREIRSEPENQSERLWL